MGRDPQVIRADRCAQSLKLGSDRSVGGRRGVVEIEDLDATQYFGGLAFQGARRLPSEAERYFPDHHDAGQKSIGRFAADADRDLALRVTDER